MMTKSGFFLSKFRFGNFSPTDFCVLFQRNFFKGRHGTKTFGSVRTSAIGEKGSNDPYSAMDAGIAERLTSNTLDSS
jgi:hypothetical protein